MARVVTPRRPRVRSVRDRAILEEPFSQQVCSVARLYGWRGHHTRKSFGVVQGVNKDDAFGWPDWAFWQPIKGTFMLRELKTQRGIVRPEQKRVIAELSACGLDCKVWRPSDWPEILETFAA